MSFRSDYLSLRSTNNSDVQHGDFHGRCRGQPDWAALRDIEFSRSISQFFREQRMLLVILLAIPELLCNLLTSLAWFCASSDLEEVQCQG